MLQVDTLQNATGKCQAATAEDDDATCLASGFALYCNDYTCNVLVHLKIPSIYMRACLQSRKAGTDYVPMELSMAQVSPFSYFYE